MMTTEITPNAQPTETVEIPDAALITKAKGLNRSIDKYVHKGIEAFWQMGEALATLFRRRHLHVDGRWESILKEIGVSGTTDRNARRFYESCEFSDLHLYKNKSDALRKLGIIATPQPIVTAPPKDANPVKEVPPAPAVPTCDDPDDKESHPEATYRLVKSKGIVTAGGGIIADDPIALEGGRIEAKDGEGLSNKKNPKPASQAPADPLETLSSIAGLLEYMNEDEFEFTPEIAAQVERASKALDLLRGKGVARAAA